MLHLQKEERHLLERLGLSIDADVLKSGVEAGLQLGLHPLCRVRIELIHWGRSVWRDWSGVWVSRRRSEKAGKATVMFTSADMYWTWQVSLRRVAAFPSVEIENGNSGAVWVWEREGGQKKILRSKVKTYCRVHSLNAYISILKALRSPAVKKQG